MPTAAGQIQPPRQYHHGTHHLDFESAIEVPDSHAWPDLDDLPSAAAAASPGTSVPVVDLSVSVDAVLGQLASACAAWGAFQVTGHGVPPGLLLRAEAASRRLFALPTSHKLRAARPAEGGASGYGTARISCFFPKLMWSEGFTIAGSPLEHARTLWPAGDPFAFCDVIEEYSAHMQRLARKLLRLMLFSLGLDDDDLGPIHDTTAVLHLNSYPACPDPNRAMGLAPHTDSTLLTLLYQSDSSGLQVLEQSNRWVTVPPMSGALIVNVGDLFQILSNGRYKSVVHRAVVDRSRHRISVAYMCGPQKDAKVSPLEKLVEAQGRAAYRAVTWPEYLNLKGKLFGMTLESCQEDMLVDE
ncbi:gibberellin 3-beta-dioxygenase 1-like [Zingiber officinale]|uniref:gibberellin 3beta-dioxygenase n=1 Tax=Zingiber officinale TaxID=94328 RepID=A0A8J5L008_ZINOF|nr:gibberellin 3-beta-dioxygenase 1-like [Zingiber officinale]KAG6502554.1 hypothetical protein ZIOFF_034838 [Zingiber officinale]